MRRTDTLHFRNLNTQSILLHPFGRYCRARVAFLSSPAVRTQHKYIDCSNSIWLRARARIRLLVPLIDLLVFLYITCYCVMTYILNILQSILE